MDLTTSSSQLAGVLKSIGKMEPGDYQLVWDGRDARGQVMASGRYFLRVALGSEVHSFQLALVR